MPHPARLRAALAACICASAASGTFDSSGRVRGLDASFAAAARGGVLVGICEGPAVVLAPPGAL